MRPAYLQIHQTAPDTYDVLWKVPALGEDLRLDLYVELPDDCARVGEPTAAVAGGAHTERWKIRRPGGLTGAAIRIAGLPATTTDVLVRLERLDGSALVVRLTPAQPSFVVEAAPRKSQVASAYTGSESSTSSAARTTCSTSSRCCCS